MEWEQAVRTGKGEMEDIMGHLEWALLTAITVISLGHMVWAMYLNKIALNEYRYSNSAALALHKITRWDMLRLFIILFTGGLAGFLAWKLWEQTIFVINAIYLLRYPEHILPYGSINMGIFIIVSVPLVSALFYIIIALIIDGIIHHKTYITIRNINQTLAETVLETIKESFIIVFIVMLFPLSIFIGHFIPFKWMFEWVPVAEIIPIELIAILIMGLRIFLPLILIVKTMDIVFPEIWKLSSKATRIKDREIEAFVSGILCDYGNKTIEAYEFPSKKQKYANAIVVDDARGRILISDYVTEQFTKEELKAVMLHEIAHIKNRHLKKMARSSLLPSYLQYAAWALGLGLMIVASMIPEGTIVLDILYYALYYTAMIIFILLFIYLIISSFIEPFKTSRLHEREADEYVVKSGIDPQVFISALQKLYRLNDSPVSLGKIEEKFSTHPSLDNRIKHINEFAKSMAKQK